MEVSQRLTSKKSSVYITFDYVSLETGAGKVCIHEIEALKRSTNLKTVISKEHISKHIDQHYPFNPFLYDYFAADLVNGPVDMAHLSCSPGMAILNKLRPKRSLVNIVAHDLKTSIEEHKRIFGDNYPYIHNVDPYLHKALLKHAKKADVVLTPSKGSAKWIKENIGPKRIEVIAHGCDLPEKVEPIPEEFKAGYLGVFGPDKGLIYLLMAWDHLDYKDAEFLFAGDCGVSLKAVIPALTDNNPRYRLLGRIPDVSEFYNSISILVQPTVTEGFGMTVPEAMIHCVPPSTKIMTIFGQKRIDNIRGGDLILTHKGRFQPVTQVFSHYYQGPLLRVYAGNSLYLTPEHSILTEDGWTKSTGVHESFKSGHRIHCWTHRWRGLVLPKNRQTIKESQTLGQWVGTQTYDRRQYVGRFYRRPISMVEKEGGRLCYEAREERAVEMGSLWQRKGSEASRSDFTLLESKAGCCRDSSRGMQGRLIIDTPITTTGFEMVASIRVIRANLPYQLPTQTKPFETFHSEIKPVQVTDTSKVWYSGIVYNLGVSGDESYCANNIIVHNCRPVIVTEGAGSSDLVEDGKEGFVIPIRNPKAIAEKIQYFRDNPSELKTMGKNARLKAEKYSWVKVEQTYGELYRELLS